MLGAQLPDLSVCDVVECERVFGERLRLHVPCGAGSIHAIAN